jgi:hypothetical protein
MTYKVGDKVLIEVEIVDTTCKPDEAGNVYKVKSPTWEWWVPPSCIFARVGRAPKAPKRPWHDASEPPVAGPGARKQRDVQCKLRDGTKVVGWHGSADTHTVPGWHVPLNNGWQNYAPHDGDDRIISWRELKAAND